MTGEPLVLHATAVAVDGHAALIQGPSGSGKSVLALEMMARGAVLVSDDRVILRDQDGELVASAPDPIQGMIEARGVGLLGADTVPHAAVCVVVDLTRTESDRLPPRRTVSLLSREVALLHKVEHPHFAAALVQYLKGGRKE
nr:HPr kinase/phosphatase C-terminal domain-containing protein [Roseivivax marinus]